MNKKVTSKSLQDKRKRISYTILKQDLHWIMDVMMSIKPLSQSEEFGSPVFHHIFRICHEGINIIKSTDVLFAKPGTFAKLNQRYASETAALRNGLKLMDGRGADYDAVMKDILDSCGFTSKNTGRLTGKPPVELFYVDDVLMSVDRLTFHRLGANTEEGKASLSERVKEWADITAHLSQIDERRKPELGTLQDIDGGGTVHKKDFHAYLDSRYGPNLPISAKLYLLLIECDLNSSFYYLPKLENGHQAAVFRARVITLYHSLGMLEDIVENNEKLGDSKLVDLRSLLLGDKATKFLSKEGGKVRNRCMHYAIPNGFVLNDNQSFFGIVEFLYEDLKYEDYCKLVNELTLDVSNFLREWNV